MKRVRLAVLPAAAVLTAGASLAAAGPASAASTNTLEDNFTRANQTGWGGSANADGVPAFAWAGDADGTHAYDTITGNTGRMAYNATNTPNFARAGTAQYNGGDALAEFSLSSIGAPVFYLPQNFCADKSCGYQARLNTNNTKIELARRAGGTTTPEASAAFTATAGQKYWMRFNYASAGVAKMRIWADGTAEPGTWNLTWTDTGTKLGANYTGLGGSFNASNGSTISSYYYAFSSDPAVPAQGPGGGGGGGGGPAISSFSPTDAAPAASVTITGSGFTGATAVAFNGTAAASYTVNSDTQITATVPSGAANGPVTVTAPGGLLTSPAGFWVDNTVLPGGFATAQLDSNTYHLQANEWGSSQAFAIATDNNLDFRIINSAISGSGVGAYPSLYKGNHWGSVTQNTAMPLLVSSAETAGTVTTSISTSVIGIGTWDDAYDIWFNNTATGNQGTAGTHNLEMMVWLGKNGTVFPAGTRIAASVTIGGNTYDVWYHGSANDTGGTVSYVLTSPVTSVSNLDLGPLSADAVSRNYIDTSWYLIGVEAGFEIWSGGQGLTVNSFSVCDPAGC
jgi:Glycosyl hydrolase family 12/IPT/TIG domain